MPKAMWAYPEAVIQPSYKDWRGTSEALGCSAGSLLAVCTYENTPKRKLIEQLLECIRFHNLCVTVPGSVYSIVRQVDIAKMLPIIQELHPDALNRMSFRQLG